MVNLPCCSCSETIILANTKQGYCDITDGPRKSMEGPFVHKKSKCFKVY